MTNKTIHGPNLTALKSYIEKKRPALYARINGARLIDALAILNEETGLSISKGRQVEETCPLFLKALQDQDEVAS
jgi:hypothetical protein